MTEPELIAECSRCAALCCVALPFDRSAAFAIDKAGGEPCRHLDAHFGCTIHDRRRENGFPGCIAFDCHGAGQWVIQTVFAGRDWRDQPELAHRIYAAFSTMRRRNEALVLLDMAKALGLTVREDSRRAGMRFELASRPVATEADLVALESDPVLAAVPVFLRSLGHGRKDGGLDKG